MNQKFSFQKTSIEGLYCVEPFAAEDERGAFVKDYSGEVFAQNGIELSLKEVFYTYSHPGVIRALHFQLEKQQPKLVRVVHGSVYDVVVDLRKDSPGFGKWEGFYLNDENRRELYIPGGCAHGYLVLEESIVSYKCGEDFYGEYDSGIRWNDPQLNIKWPVERVEKLILSEKDQSLMSLAEFKERCQGMKW